MKKVVLFILLICASMQYINAEISPYLGARIYNYYKSSRLGVLLIDRIPVWMDKTDDFVKIKVDAQGRWRISRDFLKDTILALDDINSFLNLKKRKYDESDMYPHLHKLGRGVMLSLIKIEKRIRGVGFHFVVYRPSFLDKNNPYHFGDDLGDFKMSGVIRFNFDFSSKYHEDTPDNLEHYKKIIDRFIRFFDDESRAILFVNKKINEPVIREGMTEEEVVLSLGLPESKAVIGNRLLFKYRVWKVTFENGVVTNIEF